MWFDVVVECVGVYVLWLAVIVVYDCCCYSDGVGMEVVVVVDLQ